MTYNKKKYLFVAFAVAILSVIILPGKAGRASSPDEENLQSPFVVTDSIDYEAMRLDSIAEAETRRLSNEASESYKHLKFIQYDGVTEEELYPETMKTYANVVAALDAPKLTEADKTRFKGILLDLTELFKRGSIYYSSAGNPTEMTRLAKAYVDTRMNPMMEGMLFSDIGDLYPSLIYCTASGAYNAGEFSEAVEYLNAYLSTGATDRREQVAQFLGQAAINSGKQSQVAEKLAEVSEKYPANYNLLMLALQNCLDAGYTEMVQPLLTRALAMKPGDEQILFAQGRIFENDGEYSSALDIFQQLYEIKPNSLNYNRHLALNYYNLGAEYYNKAIIETDQKVSKRYNRQAEAYLSTAADKLELVVENDPTNTKYLRALALTYGCLGNKTKLDDVNLRLQALGMTPLPMNGMPEAIAFSEKPAGDGAAKGFSSKIQDFQEFAREYVQNELADWTKKGEFEKTEDYEKRITRDNVFQQYQSLCKKAENDYLRKYADRLRISDLSLQPYDTENETYLIESSFGPMVLNVPLKNKEAEAFKSSWNAIKLKNPKYYIKDNHVAIAAVDFVTSGGKTYHFDSKEAADYDFTEVNIAIDSFLAHSNSGNSQSRTDQRKKTTTYRAQSDVDVHIPVTSQKADKTIALVIGNEDYKQVTKVESALNDAETFAKYCTMTLGIPESQVMLHPDATYAEMIGAMTKLRQMSAALGDGVDIIVYYAGHGFPDERDKDSYLLPIDGDGTTTSTAYSLKKFYADLSSMGADNVMVFLDACFSGATREGGMLSNARGVALKPRTADPEGNMFVLSAASDQQTALPYREKNHGLFTYFLLKKLQDTKGNVSLKDLSKYVEENVTKNSMTVNRKLQTPRTSVSGSLKETWGSKKLR